MRLIMEILRVAWVAAAQVEARKRYRLFTRHTGTPFKCGPWRWRLYSYVSSATGGEVKLAVTWDGQANA